MYKDDPKWITAKFDSTDANGNPVKKGEEVFYYPRTKKILTGEAAKQASRDFDAVCFDEGTF